MRYLEKTDKYYPQFTSRLQDKDDPSDLINEIVDLCDELKADDFVRINGFGQKKDLRISAYKDEDFDPQNEEEPFNLVDIHTSKVDEDDEDEVIDDALGVGVDWDLHNELWRIFHYEDFELID